MKNKKLKKSSFIKIFCIQILLVLIASAIFALENPNHLYKEGFFFLAYFSYIPILFLIHNSSLKNIWFFGGLYGALSYFLYAYWLANYDSLCLIIACSVYFIIIALLFLLLKYIDLIFIKNSWLVEFIIILAYEYIKTLGFFGFNYGVTAYTQWNFPIVIQICDVIGVFGLNAIIIFPSFVIYAIIQKNIDKKYIQEKKDLDNTLYNCDTHLNYISKYDQAMKISSVKLPWLCFIFWILIFMGTIAYGAMNYKDYSIYKQMTVCAVQHNENPNQDGMSVYTKNIQTLEDLTDEAKEMFPEIQMVVWPETSVVPSILYNLQNDSSRERKFLAENLVNYFKSRNITFVVGNNNTVQNGDVKENYNSALIFDNNKSEPEVYSKIHLVPFSEDFLWDGKIKQKLIQHGYFMFTPGKEYKVFTKDRLKYSVLICFEDTFSDIARRMVYNGAKCFINLSNDAWSKEVSCQYQHLAMAVFRSVENRVPSVRSTASGQTCIISPNGTIDTMAYSFCKTYVIGQIPVIENRELTIYSRIGDICGVIYIILSILLLIIQTIVVIIKKVNR